MVNFAELIIGLLLVGLFFFAMVNFADNLAIDHGLEQNIRNEEIINRTFKDIERNLSRGDSSSKSATESFEAEVAKVGETNLVFSSITSSLKTLKSMVVGVFSGIFTLISIAFGLNDSGGPGGIVLAVLGSILTLTVLLLIWKLIRTGS